MKWTRTKLCFRILYTTLCNLSCAWQLRGQTKIFIVANYERKYDGGGMINTAVCGQLNNKTQSLAADQACVTICHHELNPGTA